MANPPLILKVLFPPYLGSGADYKLLRFQSNMTAREAIEFIVERVHLDHPERYALYRPKVEEGGTQVQLASDSKMDSFMLKNQDELTLKGAPAYVHLQLPDGKGIQYHFQLDAEAPTGILVKNICSEFRIKHADEYVFCLHLDENSTKLLDPAQCLRALGVGVDAPISLRRQKTGGGLLRGILGRSKSSTPAVGSAVGPKDSSPAVEGNDHRGLVFGRCLHEIRQDLCNSEGIPFLVVDAIIDVTARGLDVEGVYRLSGSQEEIKKLKARYDAGERPCLSDISEVHVVTGTLKLWLRELPEPLLSFALYDAFLVAQEITAPDSKLSYLCQLVALLPPQNQALCRHLFTHMLEVAAHGEVNQMRVHNVATVVAPNLLRQEDEDTFQMVQDTPVVNNVVMAMIQQQSALFEASEAVYVASARALYDYSAEHEGEISFAEDDLVLIMSHGETEGWWYGQLGDGTHGYFPGNYVEVVADLIRKTEGLSSEEPSSSGGVSEGASVAAPMPASAGGELSKARLADELQALQQMVEEEQAKLEAAREQIGILTEDIDRLCKEVNEQGPTGARLNRALFRVGERADKVCVRKSAWNSEVQRIQGSIGGEEVQIAKLKGNAESAADELQKLKKYLVAEARARTAVEERVGSSMQFLKEEFSGQSSTS